MKKDFVGADIGASNTRYVSNSGKIGILPNNMVFLDNDESVDLEPYSNEVEDALDVTIECDNGSEFFPVRALIGQLATRYSPTNTKPSVLENKCKQQINYVSSVVAIAISKYRNSLSDNISFYLALPPIEVKSAKDIVRSNLIGNYTVTFNKLNNLQIKFTIDEVNIYEESFMALLSYFFENGLPKEKAKRFARGTVLSMDIGASTTDLAVVQDMRYLEKSGQTYKTGGNIARDYLTDSIRGLYGFDAPPEVAESIMAEGRMEWGSEYKDCSEIVKAAKQEFASQIVEQIQGYFRKINIPINTIKAIIVSGGGSMPSQYVDDEGNLVVTSEPISYYITKELNRVCQGILVEQCDNPRLANISGLFTRANVDIHRKESIKEQANKVNS